MKELSKLINEIMDEYKTITDTSFDLFNENDSKAQNEVIETLREFQKEGNDNFNLEFITINDEEYVYKPKTNDLEKTIDLLETLIKNKKIKELIFNVNDKENKRYGYYLVSENNFNDWKSLFKKPRQVELPLIEEKNTSNENEDEKSSYIEMLVRRYKHSKETEAMNENPSYNRFWDVIEKANWGELTSKFEKYDAISKCAQNLVDELKDKDKISEFQNETVDKREQLSEVIKKNSKEILSNDLLWDISAHIVGLGKKCYDNVMENPTEWEKYKDSYVENFEYAIFEAYSLI